MAALITSAELADNVGQANVDRYFDDVGAGVADPTLVGKALDTASGIAYSIALSSWTPDKIPALAADPLFKFHVAWCAMHVRARTKPEWRDANDNAPFLVEYKDATAYFKSLQQGDLRSQGEPQAGTPPTVGGTLNSDAGPNREPPTFIFAATPTKPLGSGGF